MDKFKKIKSNAIPLPMVNIDTDMIIPKQFLKTIKRTGLGKNLFYELRYDLQGNIKNNFVLNCSIRCSRFSLSLGVFCNRNELIFVFSLYSSGISSLVTDDDSPRYLMVSCLDVFFSLSHVLFTKYR